MLKKILSLIIIFSFLITQPLFVFAQGSGYEDIANELRITPKEKIISKEEGYEKVTCPSCKQTFEIKVDPNDLEFSKGLKKIVCPYDGMEFYSTSKGEATQQELQYQVIKCPTCGREFKAYVNVKAILTGQSQLLTCPYDKKVFYFKIEPYAGAVYKLANMQTVICPTDKMTFKAYVDPENPKELTCPYDGTRFVPTPELIMPRLKTAATDMSNPVGGTSFMPGSQVFGSDLGDAAQTGVAQQPNPIVPPSDLKGKRSKIEKMFAESIPLHVSSSLTQFGYEIFTRTEEKGASRETRARGGNGTEQTGNKLVNAMLTSPQQDGSIPAGAESGFSLFDTPTEIPVINDYILGPGDTLKVSIWGQVQDTFSLTIDLEGKVQLPKVGPVYLWGLKFSDAEKLLKENILKIYTNIQVGVSIEKLRSIRVFVLGEAQKPSAYQISALATVFHALYAAGGPTKLGSMRKIKLLRKGSPETLVDLYDVLLKGENKQDYKLQSGDTLFIPPIGDVVGVAGNVKRPAIYELNEKIKLSDIIEMAGGISSVGYLQRIQLERIQDHLRKVVVDLEFKSPSDLKNSENNLELQDGDLISIFPITSLRYNFVSITGNVLRPGDYELKEGMRLKDLVDKAGGILPGTYLKRAEVARFRGDQTREIIPINLTELIDGVEEANIALKEWDIITIYLKRDVVPDVFVGIDGAVNNPGKYELTENMRITDLIFKAGGLRGNAFMPNAELFKSFSDSNSKIVNIDLNKAFSKNAEDTTANNLVLEEGDCLFIRENTAKGEKIVVNLSGEFKYPGKYAVEKGMRLSAIVNRAGGFTGTAYLDGCIYTRESVKKAQEMVLKNFLETEQQALLQENASMAVGMTPVQADAKNKLIEYRKALINTLDSLEMPGRILIRLNSQMDKFENSEYDIVVEDGDTLTVGTAPATIQVVGNVYGPGTIMFSEGKGIDYYINRVGGLTKYGDINRIFIIRANGETISSFVRAVKIRRGDVIVVPEEFKYKTLPGLVVKDFVQVIYQITLGAAVTIAAVNAL